MALANREEFLADTNPLDPNSRPGVLGHLRLKDFNEVRVPFIVRAVDGETAKIEHTDGGDAKLETVKAGQTLKGTQYKVASLEAKQTQDKDGNPVDASKVVIEDEKTKQKIELVKDMPTRSAATYAILASLDGGATLTVRQGDTFNWPNEKGATYRVIDLRGDQVVIKRAGRQSEDVDGAAEVENREKDLPKGAGCGGAATRRSPKARGLSFQRRQHQRRRTANASARATCFCSTNPGCH